MTKIFMGPSGKLIKGHVLDVARAPLEQALRAYDPQLYLQWNSKKLQGEGCWELRRKPENKVVVDSVVFEGNTYSRVEYKENPMVHHVKDWAYLNYSLVQWVKDHDAWTDEFGHKGVRWTAEEDYRREEALDKQSDRAEEEKRYKLKQFKREIKDFKEYVASGNNPYRMLDYWK